VNTVRSHVTCAVLAMSDRSCLPFEECALSWFDVPIRKYTSHCTVVVAAILTLHGHPIFLSRVAYRLAYSTTWVSWASSPAGP
jgi:hypothetical protein